MRNGPTFRSRIFRLLAAVLLLAISAAAQSLGEEARRLRAQKKPPVKATHVYTNEDLPGEGGLSTVGPAAPAKVKEGEAGKEGEQAPAEGEAKPSRADLEKEYRAKAAKLRDALAAEEKKLEELKKQWLLGRQQDVQQQQEAVEKARKAFGDLEEDLRRKGLPPGWAR